MTADCPCPKEIQPLGRLYGISMGKGRVRLSTDPHCHQHNEHAYAGNGDEPCTYCGGPRLEWFHPETRNELYDFARRTR